MKHSKHYVTFILSLFFNQEKLYGHFMQHNAVAHTANISMDTLDEVFTKQFISQRLHYHPIQILAILFVGHPERKRVNNLDSLEELQ
jgi:hypothetical protein